MSKLSRIAMTSVVALALATPAFAQSTTPTPPASDTTPQAAPSGSSTGAGTDTSGSTMGGSQTQSGTTATAPTASAGDVMTEQQTGQTLSSDLIGMKVVGSNQESIGKVSELIIEDNQVVGAILDVGGFLGLGAKKVGVPWDALSVSEVEGSTVANVTLTKEELADMPEFKTIADAKAEQSRQPAAGATGGATTGGTMKN